MCEDALVPPPPHQLRGLARRGPPPGHRVADHARQDEPDDVARVPVEQVVDHRPVHDVVRWRRDRRRCPRRSRVVAHGRGRSQSQLRASGRRHAARPRCDRSDDLGSARSVSSDRERVGLPARHERASRSSTAYDCAMLDLDGVVYIGPRRGRRGARRPGAASARPGMTLAFVTNNAARTPADVAASPARPRRRGATTMTWSPPPRRPLALVAERVPPGAEVLVVGGEGLDRRRCAEHGLRAGVRRRDDDPAAVVQGFHPIGGLGAAGRGRLRGRRSGLPWVASNLDLTVPTARGHRARQRRARQRRRDGGRARAGRRGRQAVSAALRRDGPPDRLAGARSWSAIGSTPTSRAPSTVRGRRAAGDDRCDRRRRAVPAPARSSDRPTSRWTLDGLLRAHRGSRTQRGRDAATAGRSCVDGRSPARTVERGDATADATAAGLAAAAAACWEWLDRQQSPTSTDRDAPEPLGPVVLGGAVEHRLGFGPMNEESAMTERTAGGAGGRHAVVHRRRAGRRSGRPARRPGRTRRGRARRRLRHDPRRPRRRARRRGF